MGLTEHDGPVSIEAVAEGTYMIRALDTPPNPHAHVKGPASGACAACGQLLGMGVHASEAVDVIEVIGAALDQEEKRADGK